MIEHDLVEQCRRGLLLALAALGLAQAAPSIAADSRYAGLVVHVSDGDTVKLDVGGRRYFFRLSEIDAPELDQPYGREAKRALDSLVGNRKVNVRESGTDSYGRALGHLYIGDRDINAVLVARGNAWAYTRYVEDQSLVAHERAAKRAALGLWALPAASRVPPWSWRHRQPPRKRARAPTSPAATADCASKRYCRDMASCAEARDILRRCGTRTLDGDGDGRPCETLCAAPP